MRTTIHLLFGLLSFAGWGQSYSVEYHFHTLEGPCDPGNPSLVHYLEIAESPEGMYAVLGQVSCGQLEVSEFLPGTININFQPALARIRLGDDVSYLNISSEVITIYPFDDEGCFSTTLFLNDDIGTGVSLTLTITPIDIVLNSPSPNPASSCNTLEISAPPYHVPSLYNWQYGLENGDGTTTWNNLIAFQGMESIEVGIADIPGLTVNETVFFRIRYCGNSYSNILPFSLSKCSPDITTFVMQAATCSYNHDGGFTVTFSRALDPAETLLLNLAQNAPVGEPGSILVSAPILTPGDLDAANSHTWADPLPPGTYYLRYQVDNDGSVYNHGPFEITAPPPVSFSATWTNVNCYGGTDGSIEITATGGAGGYQYDLNDNGLWINFENPANHTISNLPPGDYQLRVRDAAGCTEKTD